MKSIIIFSCVFAVAYCNLDKSSYQIASARGIAPNKTVPRFPGAGLCPIGYTICIEDPEYCCLDGYPICCLQYGTCCQAAYAGCCGVWCCNEDLAECSFPTLHCCPKGTEGCSDGATCCVKHVEECCGSSCCDSTKQECDTSTNQCVDKK